MRFSQFEFIFLFLPLVLFVYEFCSKRRIQIWILIFSSFVFYAYANKENFFLVLSSIGINYVLSLYLQREKSKVLLGIGILINLLPLFFFKYFDFILSIFTDAPWTPDKYLLPLGISFLTFIQITYLVDIYQRKANPSKFSDYTFFVSFFPHLIAGPIVHHQDIIPQIESPEREHKRTKFFLMGLLYFGMGLFKKLIFADTLAQIVDPLYAETSSLNFQGGILAMFGYTLQLYFDFSGYSDMAMGLALLFGFQFPKNFESPYRSQSISEFWKRWHMTLSRFLKNYIYIPLGGNRKRHAFNLFLTMIVGGIWHGAGWTFLLWGALHGFLLILDHFRRRKIPQISLGFFNAPLVFLCVSLLWVIFRSAQISDAKNIYRALLMSPVLEWNVELVWIFGLIGVVFLPFNTHTLVPLMSKKLQGFEGYIFGLRWRALAWTSIGCGLGVLGFWGFYGGLWDHGILKSSFVKSDKYGIQTETGSFRSNFYRAEVLRGTQSKMIFVGSSYTQGMGNYHFQWDGVDFKSGSLGVAGPSLWNGVRAAELAIQENAVRILFFGISISSFEFGGLEKEKFPFPNECVAPLKHYGFALEEQNLKSCFAIEPNGEIFKFMTHPHSEQFLQFQSFLGVLFPWNQLQAKKNFEFEDPQLLRELQEARESEVEYLDFHKFSPEKSEELQDVYLNFRNSTTAHLEKRGVLKNLKSAEIRTLFSRLKERARQKNIQLIVYQSPIWRDSKLSNFELEQYRKISKDLFKSLQLEYWDLMDLFPSKGSFTTDDFHLRWPERRRLHRHVIYQVMHKKQENKL